MSKQDENHCFLSGEEINNRYFEGDAEIKAVSLDLKVNKIIKNNTVMEGSSVILHPQEMVTIILEGKIRMPNNCFGIAYPKTTLCQKGVHILNTGIIDPGYEGYLSTVAINYSLEPREIRKGDIYLRLIIYQNKTPFKNARGSIISEQKYLNDRLLESSDYPKTFLDIPKYVDELAKEASEKSTSKMTNRVLLLLTLGTIFFAAFSFWLGSINSNELKSSEVIDYKINQKLDQGDKTYQNILDRLEVIERKMNSQKK